MIKKLDLHFGDPYLHSTSSNLINFCKIFSNLEHLVCTVNEYDAVLYLLDHLSKLSFLEVYVMANHNVNKYFSQFENEAKTQNMMYGPEYKYANYYHQQVEVVLRIGCD
jgi:hypothetical protein